jgi:hypothetical protein
LLADSGAELEWGLSYARCDRQEWLGNQQGLAHTAQAGTVEEVKSEVDPNMQ